MIGLVGLIGARRAIPRKGGRRTRDGMAARSGPCAAGRRCESPARCGFPLLNAGPLTVENHSVSSRCRRRMSTTPLRSVDRSHAHRSNAQHFEWRGDADIHRVGIDRRFDPGRRSPLKFTARRVSFRSPIGASTARLSSIRRMHSPFICTGLRVGSSAFANRLAAARALAGTGHAEDVDIARPKQLEALCF